MKNGDIYQPIFTDMYGISFLVTASSVQLVIPYEALNAVILKQAKELSLESLWCPSDPEQRTVLSSG